MYIVFQKTRKSYGVLAKTPPPPAKHVTVVSSISLLLFFRPSTIYCRSRLFVRRTLSVFSPCVRPSEIIARHRRGEIPRGTTTTTTIMIIIIIYASRPHANTSPRRIYVRCRRRNAIIYQGDRAENLGGCSRNHLKTSTNN